MEEISGTVGDLTETEGVSVRRRRDFSVAVVLEEGGSPRFCG